MKATELIRSSITPIALWMTLTGIEPLASAKAAVTPAPTSVAAGAPVSGSRTNGPAGGPARGAPWKTYRHPTGLVMSYPPDWQLKELPQMLPETTIGGLGPRATESSM